MFLVLHVAVGAYEDIVRGQKAIQGIRVRVKQGFYEQVHRVCGCPRVSGRKAGQSHCQHE